VAIVPERALGGNQLMRILEQFASIKGLPKVLRTDNGKEFCSRVMPLDPCTKRLVVSSRIWQAQHEAFFLVEIGIARSMLLSTRKV
jgi:hypothetical protein